MIYFCVIIRKGIHRNIKLIERPLHYPLLCIANLSNWIYCNISK